MCPLNPKKISQNRCSIVFQLQGPWVPSGAVFLCRSSNTGQSVYDYFKRKKSLRRARWHCCSCQQRASHFWAHSSSYIFLTPCDLAGEVYTIWHQCQMFPLRYFVAEECQLSKSHIQFVHTHSTSHTGRNFSTDIPLIDLNALLHTQDVYFI